MTSYCTWKKCQYRDIARCDGRVMRKLFDPTHMPKVWFWFTALSPLMLIIPIILVVIQVVW